MLRRLAGGNISGYCREVLISHVRQELRNNSPRLNQWNH
jgi:hypothetical protein